MSELERVFSFFNLLNKYKLSISLDELLTEQGRLNYLYMQDLALKTNVDLGKYNLHKVDKNVVYDLSIQILTLLFHHFNNIVPIDDIIRIVFGCHVYGGNNPFEGYVEEINGKKNIALECDNRVESIPTIVHEGSHIIVPNSYTPNYHHREVIPIIAEFIACSVLDGMNIGTENLESVYAWRVDCLKQYFKTRTENDDTFMEHQDLSLLEKAPYIYQSHNSYSYIISTLAAFNLFDNYLEDPLTFINKLSASIKNDQNIYSLYKYFGIDFNSEKVVAIPTNILKKYI